LFVGVVFAVSTWYILCYVDMLYGFNGVLRRATGIRKSPALTADNWKELTPVGLWAALAHAFSVLALGTTLIAAQFDLSA